MLLTQRQTADLVDRIVAAVHPERIIVFGSSARGEAGRYSDIDLLVVAPEGAHRRKTAQAIYRALLGSGLHVDVAVATPSDLEKYRDSPVLVYRQALREGKELYAA
ncbi:MAG TPA: nucleotidyltransferase domain-containing protein [Candidatus Hydrogenedentes bacterium]|nr:nucleotidyltransferase domain-containing protein [Candidatus Hydrogenedentota bacterium]